MSDYEDIPSDEQAEEQAEEQPTLQSEQNSDKLTDQQSLDIQTVQRMLENLKVSPETMKMFEILKKYKHGKIKLQELYFGASRGMFKNPTFVERTIKRFYDEELTAEEKLTLNEEPQLDQPNLALNEEPKLNQTNLEVLENTLKRYFNKSGVLDKDCFLSNVLGKTVRDCCVSVGKKINNLVKELKKFLTNLRYDLKTTTPTLAGIAPSLAGRYTVADKETSIFKYVVTCLGDKKIDLEQLESFKPQIQFLETFFGFEKTFFPAANSNDYRYIIPDPDFKEKTFFTTANRYDDVADDDDVAAADDDFNRNAMAAGRTHSRRKRHASKKSCKSHRRHRRSTHNKKRNTKRHMKRHTKRYRHRK